MGDTGSNNLGQIFLLGSNIAKIGWGKVGPTPMAPPKSIVLLTYAMMDDLNVPSSITSELKTFVDKPLNLKQLTGELPAIKNLIGAFLGSSVGHKQMQAFYLGFNIVNACPMCELASIEVESPVHKGAISAVEQSLTELIDEANTLEVDAAPLRKLLNQSRSAKTGRVYDTIRAELIQYGQVIFEELGKKDIQGAKANDLQTDSVVLIKAKEPIGKLIIVSNLVLGLVLFLGGIWIAIDGIQAETSFSLLGQEFTSTSVGVALVFIGAVMVIFVVRRVLGSIDKNTAA